MHAYDIFILGLLIATTVWGARRGLARQLATLASLLLGYAVAVNFRQPLAALIELAPPWNVFAAMLGLFMGTSLAIWVAFQFVSSSIQKLGLKAFDAQMGAMFGLVKGGVLALLVTMFSVVLLGDEQRQTILSSFSGQKLCVAIEKAEAVVPGEWQQSMQPYFDSIALTSEVAPREAVASNDESQSPSDLGLVWPPGEKYEDPNFGRQPVSLERSLPDEGGPGKSRRAAEESAQATLLEPIFERR